jgi:fluoride exporter
MHRLTTDLTTDRRGPMRAHELLAVAAGGALGTGARLALEAWLDPTGGAHPLGTLVANLAGAALLGVLVGAAVAHAPTARWLPALGTGALGAMTTFSGLAVGTVGVAAEAGTASAAGHAVGTVAAGLALAALGVRAGGRLGAAAGPQTRSTAT